MSALNRRQFLSLAGIAGISATLAACRGSSSSGAKDAADAEEVEETTDDEVEETSELETEASAADAPTTAIVVFSWSGNTRSMANRISQLSGAPVWDLVPVEPYPEEYNACTDEALAEQQAGTLRAYQGDVGSWDAVDTVFLGYPIWWMDLPQITKAFIAEHDWKGKTVIPFCSYYSSGWAGTPGTIADTCFGANVVEGISLAQGDLPGGLDTIDGWYAELDLA